LFNASFDVLPCDSTRGRSAASGRRQEPVRRFRAQVHIIIIIIIIITEEPPAFVHLRALGLDVNGGGKTGANISGHPSESKIGKGQPRKWPGFTPPRSRKMPPLRGLLLLRRVQMWQDSIEIPQ
jgi:hypothetical protein